VARPQDPQTTIVIADDHAVVRSGLRMLLDAEPDFAVVADAGDVAAARREIERHSPAILVLDLHMPGDSSLSAMPALRRSAPDTQIVVLTMQEDPAFAREAIASGARGYVLKEAADTALVEAIRTVAGGGTYLQPELGARLLGEPAGGDSGALTPRETEVLRLIALGHTSAEIAESLFLSVRTVETHRSNIHGKLKLSRRADLVRYALERRLITS
jgi:two-component system response regulator NreC